MRKILMLGGFNMITQNIYRSLLNRFHVQFCPADQELLSEMYQMVLPELVLVSLVGIEEKGKFIFHFLKEKHPAVSVICVGNQEEFKRFEKEISGQQFVRIMRPVTIREIIETICKQPDMQTDYDVFTSAGKRKRKRILLIDDSAVQLRMMRELLKKDYDVDMAKSSTGAMTLIQKNLPDMIFLDYDMPQCDGRMTFEMIKNEPLSCDIPVVFLTGIGERQKVLSVLSMCPADYLLKPVEQGKILETIRNILGE